MTVTNKARTINQFNKKITLLFRKFAENSQGEMEEKYQEIGEAWARIQPNCRFQRRMIENHKQQWQEKCLGFYDVAMRNSINRNARHAEVNALRWNHKILDIFIPLQPSEDGQWLEGVAADYGKEGSYG